MRRLWLRGAVVGLLLFLCCNGADDTSASQLLVFRDLPENVDPEGPHHFMIRTNFKGSVEFIESSDFHIEVNVSSPTIDDLARVEYNYTKFFGSVLLQMYESDPVNLPFVLNQAPVNYLLLAIGGATCLAFLGALLFVCWWDYCKRPREEQKPVKAMGQDSSHAPLLEGRPIQGGQPQNGNNRARKRRKKATPQRYPGEEYVSSEDDYPEARGVGTSPRKSYPTATSPKKQASNPGAAGDMELYATIRKDRGHDSPCSTAVASSDGGVTSESTTATPRSSQLEMPGSKPIVSYIKIQGNGQGSLTETDGSTKRKGHYIPLANSDGSGTDLDKQATLKIRRDNSSEFYADPMPDVVKSRAMYSEPPLGNPKNTGQYVSLSRKERNTQEEPDYSTINKQLSGAHVASILSDKSKGSPKYSHNTDRPPVTFSTPAFRDRDRDLERDLERVELDSVGSSRSGESSVGGRTQGSSSFGHAPSTDSDSTRSSSSTGVRSKDSSTYSGGKYYTTPPTGGRHNGMSVSASSTDRSSLDSGSTTRLIDEAYGTMGSNGSNTLRGSSTASTGSGSSGSVVTVIAAEDPNSASLGHRKMFSRSPEGRRSNDTGGRPASGPNNGGSTYAPHKYLHTSVVCFMSVLCLMGGVYSQLLNETVVHIKVYAPPGFLKYKPQVYHMQGKEVNVSTHFELHSLDVDKFEVEDAQIHNLGVDRCKATRCEQGCDASTGRCLCRQGYYRKEDQCYDIDECKKNTDIECDPNAKCDNLPGSYRCQCMKGYYGNGKDCRSCDQPCMNGTYEAMPCNLALEQPKVCKECSATCMEGYYISAECTPKVNRVCRACKEKCKHKQYEYTPCAGRQDRQCRDIDSLPKPTLSSNLVYENMRQVVPGLSYVLHQDAATGPLTHMLPMKRGSGFSVNINIKEANLAPLFRPVDHSASNDNEGFYGNVGITEEYCPYPVPEKYKLSLALHQGVTTKAQYYSCSSRKRSAKDCETETGFYLNAQEACESYSPFGRLPNLNADGWSILCTKPGKLSDVFGVSSELGDLTTMFVDKTVQCAEQRSNCDSCSEDSASTMESYKGSHRCNITGEDSDNGESPRLAYCLNCYSKQKCSKLCEVYHDSNCQPLRCVTGNLAEFVLTPAFSLRGSMFGCHIEPVPRYKIYDIEYSVTYNGKTIQDKRLKSQKLFEGEHPEKAIDDLGFLKVYYGSYISNAADKKPNLIEGDSSLKTFSVGRYQAKGQPLTASEITSRTQTVRPKLPFSVSTKTWKRQACDTSMLDELIVTSNIPPDSDPYQPDPLLQVEYVSKGQYRLFNKSDTYLPFIYFEVPRDRSILRPMFESATIKDDSSLKVDLVRETEWNLRIKGELSVCPGSFGIKVKDPNYATQPLFDLDVGVKCPKEFSLDLHIPTEGQDVTDRKLQVELTDSFRTIKMTVLRPRPNVTKEAKGAPNVLYSEKRETEMTIFTPFIAVLCVVISFLALLLLVGFITESVGRKIKKMENKVHSQHLLFVVCYVTFRAGYSIAVTFTVLLLLIRHVNRDSLSTLSEFNRYAESAENNQRVEIDKIQAFVMEELSRQNNLAYTTKFGCELKLLELQNVLEETKQQMRVDNNEEKLVSQVALQYTKLMILNLTHSITKFKEEFSSYSRHALDRLKRSIVQTSSALQSNKWLRGAKVIYNVVQRRRSTQGQSTKPFMEWVGLQQEVERLTVDLSLKNFPMPNLTDFLNIEIPKTNTRQSSIPKISDITLPRNQWYYQFEKKPTPPPVTLKSKRVTEVKVRAEDIISWMSLLAILVVIDLVWFVHRMAKTYSTAKMILYGCPCYVDCRKTGLAVDSMQSPRKPPHKQSASSRCLHFIKDLNLRVMKTEFVPKLIATATTCCAIYLALAASDKLLTVKTFASVGYFESLVAPVETSYRLAKTRIKTNSLRINKFEYPFYEELVNVRTKRYQLMLDMYAELQKSNNILHDSEYCAWRKMLNPADKCNCTTAHASKLKFDGCELPPVSPHAYQRKDFSMYREQLSRSIVPYINSGRQVVMDTCHLVLIFVSILVLVDALGAVTWIYLKRFNLLRLKPMFEVEHFPTPEAMGNHT